MVGRLGCFVGGPRSNLATGLPSRSSVTLVQHDAAAGRRLDEQHNAPAGLVTKVENLGILQRADSIPGEPGALLE